MGLGQAGALERPEEMGYDDPRRSRCRLGCGLSRANARDADVGIRLGGEGIKEFRVRQAVLEGE